MKFKVGDLVRTTKGGRFPEEGPFEGEIVSFCKWREYDAAMIKKRERYSKNWQIVRCLVKNLEPIKSFSD